MSQFWYTVAGRHFIEGTMPKIERHLERIANALENLAVLSSQGPIPLCDDCDHRHYGSASCLAEGCDCNFLREGGIDGT